MHAYIAGVEYYLPSCTLTTQDLAAAFPSWSVEKIDAKTGIQVRHIAAPDECASDLAAAAAAQMFRSGLCEPCEIDFILFCSQSADYALPSTACLLQDRLGIPQSAGALDYNLGCSGYVYGLGLCEGLVASGQAKVIMLITADTYSKYIRATDRPSRTIFGDGAAVTLIRAEASASPRLGPFVYGTDGEGARNLIVPSSGARTLCPFRARMDSDPNNTDADGVLFMDGAEVFRFAMDIVPRTAKQLLRKANLSLDQIDLFVMHQANAYLLDEIRMALAIPPEKFVVVLSHCANTVSSTIPIALWHAQRDGRLKAGDRLALIAFGVGYSWSGTIVRWFV